MQPAGFIVGFNEERLIVVQIDYSSTQRSPDLIVFSRVDSWVLITSCKTFNGPVHYGQARKSFTQLRVCSKASLNGNNFRSFARSDSAGFGELYDADIDEMANVVTVRTGKRQVKSLIH